MLCVHNWYPQTIRAPNISHTGPKVCDHYILRSLIDWKRRDCPNSLHTWRWRPTNSKKSS
jgi:hypothetical protein